MDPRQLLVVFADALVEQRDNSLAAAIRQLILRLQPRPLIGVSQQPHQLLIIALLHSLRDQLLGLHWKRLRILDEAAQIEGHPDNVAACVLGSIVATAMERGGSARAVRLELPAHYGVAVVVPDFVLPTSEARAVLPECYSREDTIFNVQRSALLIAALATGTTTAFPAALEDRLHQPYRYALVPGLDDIVKLRAPGLLGCALSGAGPSGSNATAANQALAAAQANLQVAQANLQAVETPLTSGQRESRSIIGSKRALIGLGNLSICACASAVTRTSNIAIL